ncbi:uncharacterized protein LOC134301133 isoform X2 [Trichomycterus rosablanca]|uniref:uncharacterized protein LOC134301133 isoform X2 n=1 Tax=Trichomycterus rosablanca TaxID=2290929 RepID=UPI002F35A8CA
MMILLLMSILPIDGYSTNKDGWSVFYPERNICAVRGFSATLPCNYSYPQSGYKVVQKLWCSMDSNSKWCVKPPYVYDSTLNVTSDFVYGGDDKSNCTLFIQNVKFYYSGEYRFRFITDVTGGKWTGDPGVTLTVSDLKVELIRLSGNGTLKPGDSLNLTCHVYCTHSSSQTVWSKNNQNLDRSGPVLHFPSLTAEDSGNYTCTWNSSVSSGSDTISIYVEGLKTSIFIIMLVVSGVILIGLVMAAIIYNLQRRKIKTPEENKGQSGEKTQTHLDQDQDQVPQPEVTYATLSIKTNKPPEKNVQDDQQDDSVIYSDIKLH